MLNIIPKISDYCNKIKYYIFKGKHKKVEKPKSESEGEEIAAEQEELDEIEKEIIALKLKDSLPVFTKTVTNIFYWLILSILLMFSWRQQRKKMHK